MGSSGVREIALDTETTGLNPKNGDKIVEIGCVELIDKVKTGNIYHVYINPQRDVPDEAYRIHGISTEFLQDKPIFEDISKEFMAFLGDARLVIHNAQFDLRFLNHELSNVGHREINFDRAIDTLIIARSKFPGAQSSLDALCKRFGVDLSKRTKHGALLDAELLADVYVELMGGNQSSMMLNEPKSKKKTEKRTDLSKIQRDEVLQSRAVQPSGDELEKHGDFVKKLKQPVWNN